jgi:hypothetical protein
MRGAQLAMGGAAALAAKPALRGAGFLASIYMPQPGAVTVKVWNGTAWVAAPAVPSAGVVPRTAVAVAPGTVNVATRVLARDPSWQDGDFLVVHLAWTNATVLTPPVGGGFTLDGTVNSNGTNISSAVYTKRLSSADVGPWTWTIGTGTRFGIEADAYGGVHTTTPVAARSQMHTAASYNAPAVTTTAAAYVVSFWAGRMTTTALPTMTPPATHTLVVRTSSAAGGTTVQLAMLMAALTVQPTAAGTFGPYAATGFALDAAAHRQIALTAAP